jgi:hypothetical protein
MPDIDAASFKLKSIEELLSKRSRLRRRQFPPTLGQRTAWLKGPWAHEIEYYEVAMERMLALKEEEKEIRPRGDRRKRNN